MSSIRIPFVKSALSMALAAAMFPAYLVAQELTVEEKQAKKIEAEDKASEEVEVIEIKGLRSSLMKAQDLKMNSDSILDAIVAEDIGKLPDLTAAESIARIPGVQVQRRGDEARDILIRGLPDVATTFNGRELFTAELRSVQLQDFPSQALSGIEVYKSGTADLIEPGLAGLVNVTTRRPFDFEGQKISGTLRYVYNDQSEESSPTGSLLYSNRWQTDLGEMGFLGNVTYAESKYHNGVRYNDTWFRNANAWGTITPEEFSDGDFLIPSRVGLYNDAGKRTRPSWNMAMQWRPNDKLEIYADAIYQGFRGERQADSFWFHLADWDFTYDNGDPNLSNVVMVEGTNNGQAASLTKSGGWPARMYRSTSLGETNTYQYAIGAIWQSGPLKIVTDLAYTDSTYENTTWSFDSAINQDWIVDVDFFGDKGATFSSPNANVSDASAYEMRGYFESDYDVGGAGVQWKTDLTYTFDDGFLNRLQAGFRITDRDAKRNDGSRYADLMDLHIPLTSIDYLDLQLTHNPYRSSKQGFTQYLAPTRDSIAGNHEQLRQLSYDKLVEKNWMNSAARFSTPNVEYNPDNYFLAQEQSYAGYLQAKFIFDIGSIPVDIISGVRIVKTATEVTGTSRTFFDDVEAFEQRTSTSSYTDVLPNISAIAYLGDDWQLRAGYTQTRTRVGFGDLNPALQISEVSQVDNPDPNAPEPEFDATGSSGNPDLEPLTSDNYDLSLAYYFSESGYLSAATFYRDLFGFTNRYDRIVEDEEYGRIRLNKPENSGEGELWGWEVNAQTFMDYDFVPESLRAFGASANITRLDGENRLPTADGTFGDFRKIPGISKYTYNFSFFYEKEGLSARLSYNRRDDWVNWYRESEESEGFTGNKTKARDRLDFSISYDFNESYTLYADVSNIMANPFHNYVQHTDAIQYTQDVRDEGRYYGIGLKFSF